MPFRAQPEAAIAPITLYLTPATPTWGLSGSANGRNGLLLPLARQAIHGKTAARPTKLLLRRPLETTFSLVDQIQLVSEGSEPSTRLVCTFERDRAWARLDARSLPWLSDFSTAIDFFGNPDTEVVDRLAVEGVAGSEFSYGGRLAVYFR